MRRWLSQPEPSAPIVQGTHGQEATVSVSVVWAIDGPRFVVVATTEEECLTQIAQYVAEQARWRLWPPAAHRVAALLENGDRAGAVVEYFSHVGERWEAEWLTAARLGLAGASGVWSGSPPLPGRPPIGSGEPQE